MNGVVKCNFIYICGIIKIHRFMKKQFEILDELNKLSKETNERISSLREVIEIESNKLKLGLLNAYSHHDEVMYLVEFGTSSITLYKATKENLTEVCLSWYKTNKGPKIPNIFDEADDILKNYQNPTNCELRSYISFGYFDDIKKRWDRIDWIAEHVQSRKFLYEVTESDFIKSIKTVAIFHNAI